MGRKRKRDNGSAGVGGVGVGVGAFGVGEDAHRGGMVGHAHHHGEVLDLGGCPLAWGLPNAEAATVFRHGAHCRRGDRHRRGLTADQVIASVKPASRLVMSITATSALTVV